MTAPLEMWGGVECTRNRVKDGYLDQLVRSGHESRMSDLELIAALGIRRIRYPFLWERVVPELNGPLSWSWIDERITKLDGLGIEVIAGFLHHGSGPHYTNLIDLEMPQLLADYAYRFAERFPCIKYFTPVNEPLTTARFSALYGFWYPHHKSAPSFLRALLLQSRATVLAMNAIRRVRPDAELIQTEDLGRTLSRPALSYQANFENERRWLSFDLLMGRVDKHHFLWKHFLDNGVFEHELHWHLENTCTPAVMGINHYLTSNRFLDERLSQYPASTHGGNGLQRYADVESVRIGGENFFGLDYILEEVWSRYHLPIAVTECHLGCSRDEQLRWLAEVWGLAQNLKARGVNILAVTAWAMLGSFDWNTLCTFLSDHYEAGCFDVRSPTPRPTVLSRFVRAAATSTAFDHPVLDGSGWWHRPSRIIYGDPVVSGFAKAQSPEKNSTARKLLITGGKGTLAAAFAKICELRGLPYVVLARETLDIANQENVRRALEATGPWAIVNAAGYVDVDRAETNSDVCYRENLHGPVCLARECASRQIPLVTFSTDMVFDGHQNRPYVESDRVSPLNVYGQSKACAEADVLAEWPSSLIVRSSAFFGPWDSANFLTQTLTRLYAKEKVRAADDLEISPTYVPDLVNATLDLLIDSECGIWHLASGGSLTWFDFAKIAADKMNLPSKLLIPAHADALGYRARRPRFSVLKSERGQIMPAIDFDRYFRELDHSLIRNVRTA